MSLPYYEFSGSPNTIGEQHGEALRNKIRELSEERIHVILESYPWLTKQDIRAVAESGIEEMRIQVPEVYEEATGVSRSSKVPMWELAVAGGLSDIEHRASEVCSGKSPPSHHECTIIPTQDETGRHLLSGTWDSHATAIQGLVVIERHPVHGPATLALSTAGWPMQQGINSFGLGFAIANVVPITTYAGITYIAALPRIAAQPNTIMAKSEALKLRLCSGRYYALLDDSGVFIGIETDGKRYWTTKSMIIHTNHYLLPDAINFEGRTEYRRESEARRSSAELLLERQKPIDIDSLFSVFAYCDDTPSSIFQGGVGRETRTGAAFVIDPVEQALHYRIGSPGNWEKRLLKLNIH